VLGATNASRSMLAVRFVDGREARVVGFQGLLFGRPCGLPTPRWGGAHFGHSGQNAKTADLQVFRLNKCHAHTGACAATCGLVSA